MGKMRRVMWGKGAFGARPSGWGQMVDQTQKIRTRTRHGSVFHA